MKKSFIVFCFDVDGYLKPYQNHPVFSGEIAPDCVAPIGSQGASPKPNICNGLKVREFDGPGQVMAALGDYSKGYHLSFEERANFKPEKIQPFVILERIVLPNK